MTNKSPLAAILNKVKKAEEEGKKVINLAVGEPDFGASESVKFELSEKLKSGGKAIDAYTETLGIEPLRRAIAERFNKECGSEARWRSSSVILTPGAKFALFAAIYALVNTNADKNGVLGNDKLGVVILNPAWPTFSAQVKLAGASPVFVDTMNKKIDLKLLESVVEKYPPELLKAIIINSPSNPTGRVLKAGELEAVSDFAKKYDLWIISDEIYRRISYIKLPSPIARFAPEKAITIGGFSKEYAMTGWRLGYAIAPEEIISEMEAYQSQTITCASSIVQYAGLAALESDEANKEAEKMAKEFTSRREIAAAKLSEIPGISFSKPDGAFYFFINVREYLTGEIKTVENLADYLFEKSEVAIAPGSVFGASDYIRLSFAVSRGDLEKAIEKIKIALGKIKKKD